MTAVDKHPAESKVALWRDPVWLGVVAIFVVTSAVVIGAIAGRAAAVIDVWALAVGGVVAASVAAASVAIVAWRQQTGARATVSSEIFLQALPHPSAIIDNTGRAQSANDKFQQLFPDAQHAPLTALKRRIGDDIGTGSAASDHIGRLIVEAASGSAATIDVEIVDDGDGIKGLCVSAMPLADQSGSTLWTFEDITTQRSAAAEVREIQENLTEAITSAPVGFFSVDQDGRFLLVNDALASWLGYEPGAIEQQNLCLHDILVAPSPQTAAYRVAGTKDAEAEGAEQEVALLCRDGDPLPVIVIQAENRSEDGRLRTSSVVRQMVVEHETQPSLISSEHRFERMFENAPVGVVLLDDRGRVMEANKAWQMLVAPGEENLTGRSITEFVADDSAGDVETWIERVADVSAPVTPQDVTLRTKTTTDAPRIATMYYNRMEGARDASGLIVHFHEATEQRSLEEQFAQSQKMQAIGQLAGGVAHDFNNLLTAMIGFCDLLLLRHSPGDQSFGDIMQIKQNANRAARLVRQLLAFSRQQTLQPRVLSITDVLGDLTNLLRRLIGANIKLNITHGRELGLVRVDQGQLEQVVINLAVNARDAMRDGGELTVRTFNESVVVETRRGSEVVAPGDYVVIEIADNGSGIALEIQERIFEPFFTTKEIGAGTGLGLSTVYGIVKQTGGQIFVDSAPGEGAKFTIMIPRHEADAADEVRKVDVFDGSAAADTTGVGTVLLVEDEDAVRLFSARALRAKGYKVLEARTGEAALELLGAVDDYIDLMITDVVMPEMDGPTLIKEMRNSRPDLRVICISGYAEETFRDKLDESDDIHFLPKPFSLNQLAGKVKDVMNLPNLPNPS
ncbi:MAG: PAS domain-containing protein [Alphaproteobacteria bacterium]|nr:PAS domain-containing protein [Alphaproteobacteria bacterium]